VLSSGGGRLIGVAAVCVVAIIFVIQNIHAANISFLGIHLLLPWPSHCSSPLSRARC
jgi:hypothetical protein